jgi:O-antigen ligase
VVIWLEARFLLRKRDFLIGLALLAGLVSAGLLWAINQYSAREFLSGRLRLWTLAMRDILRGPDFLVAGYLSVPPRGLNVFYYPHNIYLLAWTMYGLVGLAALAALAVFVLGLGWRRYRELRDQPTFASLWAGMVGLFLVNGMANFYFQETFHQLMFVTALLLMLGLNPSSPARSPVSNSPATGGPL